MKRLFASLFLLLFIASVSFAESPKEQNIVIDINDDGSTYWQVELKYSNATEKSDLFVMAYIKDVQVTGESSALECNFKEEGFGTLIQCENIKERVVKYRFTAFNLVRSIRTAKMFSYPFQITGVIDEFNLTLNLPLGAGIVEEGKIGVMGMKPFMPEEGTEGSDGRKIFIKWFFVKPPLGKSIEVYAIYEQIFGAEQLFIGIAIAILLVPLAASIFFFRRRGSIKQVLPVLNEHERAVMQLIIDSGGEVDQRKIVKECDMSKSKISRVVKELEDRGLITVTKRGRSNKLKLAFNTKAHKRDRDSSKEESSEKKKEAKNPKNPGNNPFYTP